MHTTLMLNLRRSKDAVVNLWDLSKNTGHSKPYKTIDCSSTKVDSDLTSLDWNCHGTLLSVGSYDAMLRIYMASGELYFESRLHKVCRTLAHHDISVAMADTCHLPFKIGTDLCYTLL